MDKLEFESFVELKIRDIIPLVMERKAFDFETALHYLYKSRLYSMLLIENTKLWHLSCEKLYEIVVDENDNNQLILPDYV